MFATPLGKTWKPLRGSKSIHMTLIIIIVIRESGDLDFLIFPAKTGAKKKKQMARSKKRNQPARSKAGLVQTISPLEEGNSDDGESDHDEVTEKHEISREPEVSETARGEDDEEAESEFVSVVRTKKKKNKKSLQSVSETPGFRSERSLGSPGSSSAKVKERTPGEDSVGYNAMPAPCYNPGENERLEDGNIDVLQQLEELSVTTNVRENEREPSVPRELMPEKGEKGSLRPIVIDGSNVAYCHGEHQEFSIRGIEIVVEDFTNRGYEKKEIVVFLPQYRDRSDRELREKLKAKCSLSFAPRRQQPSGEIISSHDDYYILNYAAKHGAVVVTRDNYRDHANQKPEWDAVIRHRILMPTFVGDDIQWPEDPLGRTGPCLQDFLKFRLKILLKSS